MNENNMCIPEVKDVKEYAVKCFKDEAQALLDLIPQLDDNFNRAVDLIYHCKGKVITTGVGKSGHIAAKIAATFSSTGTPSFYINPLDVFHGDLGVITPQDVVLAISYSGQTDELLRFVPFLLERNVPIIGLTGNGTSLLAKYSTCHLSIYVKREACPLNLAPTSSTTATIAMGDALACALMEVRHFKASDFAQFHPGGSLGKRLLTRAEDIMRTEDLPVISPDITLGEAITDISKGRLGLCVAEVDGKIVGIITDGDIRRAVESSRKRFFDLKVNDIMTRTPKTVPPEMRITEIEQLMNKSKIHAVLVVDKDNHLLGVVDHFSCEL